MSRINRRVARSLLAAVIVSVPIAALAQVGGGSSTGSSGGASSGASGGASSGAASGTSGGSTSPSGPSSIFTSPSGATSPSPGTTPDRAGRPEAGDPAAPDSTRSGGGAAAAPPSDQTQSGAAALPGVPSDVQSSGDAAGDNSMTRGQAPNEGPAGVPNLDPNIATGGGRARMGATGKTMSECLAAWDAETHLSRNKWRETCQRTLTEPHL